jgi:hypothetical protein
MESDIATILGVAVNEMALGQILLRILPFCPYSLIPLLLHTHSIKYYYSTGN